MSSGYECERVDVVELRFFGSVVNMIARDVLRP